MIKRKVKRCVAVFPVYRYKQRPSFYKLLLFVANAFVYLQENVEGGDCSRCKAGFFNLQQDNPKGCEECFCSGVSNRCQSSYWTYGNVSNPHSLPDPQIFPCLNHGSLGLCCDHLTTTFKSFCLVMNFGLKLSQGYEIFFLFCFFTQRVKVAFVIV